MFSKELLELDRNTVQYMIDEMQDEIDEQREQNRQKDKLLEEKDEELARVMAELEMYKRQQRE